MPKKSVEKCTWRRDAGVSDPSHQKIGTRFRQQPDIDEFMIDVTAPFLKPALPHPAETTFLNFFHITQLK
jgi:hypothetical protein